MVRLLASSFGLIPGSSRSAFVTAVLSVTDDERLEQWFPKQTAALPVLCCPSISMNADLANRDNEELLISSTRRDDWRHSLRSIGLHKINAICPNR